jgi:hypothetical protein
MVVHNVENRMVSSTHMHVLFPLYRNFLKKSRLVKAVGAQARELTTGLCHLYHKFERQK